MYSSPFEKRESVLTQEPYYTKCLSHEKIAHTIHNFTISPPTCVASARISPQRLTPPLSTTSAPNILRVFIWTILNLFVFVYLRCCSQTSHNLWIWPTAAQLSSTFSHSSLEIWFNWIFCSSFKIFKIRIKSVIFCHKVPLGTIWHDLHIFFLNQLLTELYKLLPVDFFPQIGTEHFKSVSSMTQEFKKESSSFLRWNPVISPKPCFSIPPSGGGGPGQGVIMGRRRANPARRPPPHLADRYTGIKFQFAQLPTSRPTTNPIQQPSTNLTTFPFPLRFLLHYYYSWISNFQHLTHRRSEHSPFIRPKLFLKQIPILWGKGVDQGPQKRLHCRGWLPVIPQNNLI